jgi:hypothetical protein
VRRSGLAVEPGKGYASRQVPRAITTMFTAIWQRPDPILQSPIQCKEDTSMINLPARYETGTPFTQGRNR